MSDPDPFLPEDDDTVEEKPAWGFRITLVLLALYLAYRFVQLGVELAGWISSR